MKPEITQCPIYWEALPEWAQFVTIDYDGEIFAWERLPSLSRYKNWHSSISGGNFLPVGNIPVNPDYCERYIWQREY